MDDKGAPAEPGSDLPGQTANNTPSKPRQAGHAAAKKQPRAAKQLRFEGHTAALSVLWRLSSPVQGPSRASEMANKLLLFLH